MSIFRNVVFIAAISGLLAGVVLAALQTYATVPLILKAETYENAGGHEHVAAPTGGTEATAPAAGTEAPTAQAAAPVEEEAEAWAPADGAERFAYSALANIVSGVAFALILVAVSEFAGGIANWRQGVFWGFAGFAVFTLAPGLGLPPELPAMPAADLGARQIWWTLTVAATAAGLALIAFKQSLPLAILGVALIVAPHIVGAPQPESHESPIPADLHHSFVVAVTITNLVFWVVLGAVAGFVRNRFMSEPAPSLNGRLA
ncbi:cobalt transporter subunit CbtA [Aminobacter lissarensis]|uniref:Cobalt transporter subunit CbtA n=1 Tax=Aminobacter carboxidus TaxID=376165 RepID=A0A8E2BB46_9HYPH|nr:CbtA family protein [Aminobacter lissarensis]MBB6464709.1 cobalt transporter subunit CbtA [Aminobacter lissarensis]